MFVGIFIVQFLVMGLVFAVVLRAAVWLFNRVFGKQVQSPFAPGTETKPVKFDSYDVAESGPYTPPATYASGAAAVQVVGVPTLSFGKALLVSIAVIVAQGALQAVLVLVIPTTVTLAFAIGMSSYVAGFAVLAWLLKLLLPTTFRRGLAVAGIFYLILLGIGLVIAGLLPIILWLRR